MKRTFQQLYVNFPQAAHEFSFWMMNQYKIREQDYDDSISEHRYIIAARFFGEPTEAPAYVNADGLEEKLEDMFNRYQQAIVMVSDKDPLKELTNLDWKTRNEMTEQSFTRKTNPGLRDCLILLTKFRLPGLSDALIPWKGITSEFGRQIHAMSDSSASLDEEQVWLENIQWAWDVSAGKIKIPF